MPPSLWQRLLSLFRPQPQPRIPTVADIRAVSSSSPHAIAPSRPKQPAPTPAQLKVLRTQALKLVAPHIRPTFIPRVQPGTEGPFTGSRFCGPAALKPGEPWPTCACGRPLQLFLQLNSANLPAAAGKPFGDGLLQFFYCTAGCDHDDYAPFSPAHLARILPLSSDLCLTPRPESKGNPTYPAAAIIGWEPPASDLPNYEEMRDLDVDLTDDQERALYESEDDRFPRDGDKLLGWPDWVQSVEYPNCPRCNARMQFLFQIDSEQNIPYMFGDCGVGHLTICPTHRDVLAFGWACC